jgi:hypothetical protein
MGWTSKSGDSCHVGRDTVLLACSSWCVHGLLHSEEEHIKIFWNVKHYTPNNPVTLPKQYHCVNTKCGRPVILQQSNTARIQKYLPVITVSNESWCCKRRQELSCILRKTGDCSKSEYENSRMSQLSRIRMKLQHTGQIWCSLSISASWHYTQHFLYCWSEHHSCHLQWNSKWKLHACIPTLKYLWNVT